MNKIVSCKKEINKTNKILRQYGCSFKEYMKDSGRRDDIDLGDTVVSKNNELLQGMVVGWNSSCNYNVFSFSDRHIINMHPNSVYKKNIS